MISLIGDTGFVGRNILEQNLFKIDNLYNTKNIQTISHIDHDIIICAAPSAEKWRANLYPEQDLQSINNLINNLKNISKQTEFFLISTIDVYGLNNYALKESDTPIPDNFYGKHRLTLEQFIKESFIKHHIIRLPGLFGKHLKKNIIFDLLNNNIKDNTINLYDEYQWFDLDNLKDVFDFVQNKNIDILNVSSEPISNTEVLKLFDIKNLNLLEKKKLSYNIKTIYHKNEYLYDKKYILNKIGEFVHGYRNI